MRLYLRKPDPNLSVELETERFVLRPVGAFEMLRDPGGWRRNPRILRGLYQSSKPMSFPLWTRKGPIPDGVERFMFAIVPKGTVTPIGYHLVKRHGYRSAGNTAGIHDEAWLGRNVVVEVRAKLMNHFYRHGVERFAARIASINPPSIFNYRKLGYAHVGTQHREQLDEETGETIDFLLFEMFKDRWIKGPYAEPDL